MTPGWNDALELLLAEVEGWIARPHLGAICVVRDLRGQFRLVVQPREPVDVDDLEQLLTLRLGGWLARPILSTDGGTLEMRRLARGLLDHSRGRWPDGWPTTFTDGFTRRPLTPALWHGDRRVRSKDSWLHRGHVTPPWPLHPRQPAVASFYSFKGGVGRTTTLGIVARRLASSGHRVAVIDLDLEAPGLGRFFDVETERGVLDLLSEHQVTGSISRETLSAASRTLEIGTGQIFVYPVGALDASYIERLACLDFTPQVSDQTPVEVALRSLLKTLRAVHRELDYILIDARAGLHDLGGLSLHALSHVDVLVGRPSRATLDGFSLVLHALARRRARADLRVILAQTFLPLPVDSESWRSTHERWTSEMFNVFAESIYTRLYDPEDQLPEVRAPDAHHRPWPIPEYDSIARADRLQEIDETVLDALPFLALATRIAELCNRPPPASSFDEEPFEHDDEDEDEDEKGHDEVDDQDLEAETNESQKSELEDN